MRRFSVSLGIYRVLLRIYPTEFRERFADDLQSDFARMLDRHGRLRAWAKVVVDLLRSTPLTHDTAHRERRRVYAITLGGESDMGTFVFDVRHAVRALLKAPVFTVVTVLTLALGIGANSAIFSLVNAVLLRPLGYEQPERLMMIHEAIPESKVPRFGVSPADYLDLTTYQTAFTDIGAYRTRSFELSGTGSPEQVTGVQLSSSVFPILGVNAASGRTFLPEEDQEERSVIVISDALNRRRFAGRPAVGERLVLDRQPYTIVGVMPASFQFPKRGPQFNSEPADVFMPLIFNPFERRARGMFYNHSVVGRLRDGMTPAQATADTAALASRIRANYPPVLRDSPFSVQVLTTPIMDEIAGQVRRPLLILLGAVGLVLLVACANVANLILSRSVTRQREIGVRSALGAARYRLFQMLLVESLLLALAGGALGLVLGHWGVRATPAVIASSLPGVSDVALDVRVVTFTLALSMMTALLFGLVPLVAGSRRDLSDVLREGARSIGGRRQHRLQSALVVTSVAFAVVLLVGAGLLIRSFSNLMAVDSGVRAFNVLSMEVTLPHAGYKEAARTRAFYRTLTDRLREMPGVKAVSISTDLPLKPDGERRAFTPDEQPNGAGGQSSIAVTWTHGDYFTTFGVPLIKGRTFAPEEQVENRQVMIVSKGLADRYWPGQDPIGKRIKWGLPQSTAPWQTVIGVAGDVDEGALGSEPFIHAYVPYSEMPDQGLASPIAGLWRRMNIAVNAHVEATELATPVRLAVAAIDPALAVTKVETMTQVMNNASAPQRFSAMVLTAFAAGALLLAGIGLYGVLAFGVSQRTREIGVRLALGAGRREVLRLVVREGMLLVGIGLVIGCAGAIAATRVMKALLFETNVYDPWTFAVVPILLAVVSLAACYMPARRAGRVDPMVALRTE